MVETRAREAVIIAGGFGTRLLPLTARRPKHLLEVGGAPFLDLQLFKLAAAGVRHCVLATSYHADAFLDVIGNGERFGMQLTYVTEEVPLGTGGAVRNVVPALRSSPSEPVLVLNGDVLSGHDLQAQTIEFERRRQGRDADVSLHLVRVSDPRQYGCVPTDETGRVTAFVEKSPTPVSSQVNAGCYVIRRQRLDDIPTGRVVSLEYEMFPRWLTNGLVVGYLQESYWRDIGTPQALVAASRDVVEGRAPAHPPRRAGQSLVHPDARVRGHVSRGTSVLVGAVVDEGAVVDGSIVMAGARISAGARIEDSVVGPGAIVGTGVRLREATLGDESEVPADATPPAGTRVSCGSRWHP
jgi:mannose-1-phosphate guanylyltransferase